MPLLVMSEMSGPFVNTLTSCGKNYFGSSENLREPVQMQLCTKQKMFSQFSVSLLKCK